MRRTGKRAFDPTMASDGISQLLITYSIFMARGPHSNATEVRREPKGRAPAKRPVFSHERAVLRRPCRRKKNGRPKAPVRNKPVSGLLPGLHVIGSLAVRVDVEAFALLLFGH